MSFFPWTAIPLTSSGIGGRLGAVVPRCGPCFGGERDWRMRKRWFFFFSNFIMQVVLGAEIFSKKIDFFKKSGATFLEKTSLAGSS